MIGNRNVIIPDGAVMRVEVIEALCRGEGLCERICPQVFRIVGGVSRVARNPVPHPAEPACREAARHCPSNAIRLVAEDTPPPTPNARRKKPM